MRAIGQSAALRVRAIAGSHVVILAWDAKSGRKPKGGDLLGYAVERSTLEHGAVIEKRWVRGIKRFQDKDRGLPAGTPVSSAEHPIQTFQWGDYTVRPGRTYRYRVLPVRGTPLNLTLQEGAAASVDVITEPEGDFPGTQVRHDVFFNRGVIGSQAYAREFGNRDPRADDPTAPEMVWLSRGLFEALTGFIALAKDGMGLRGAFYEFHYQPAVDAFARAVEAGADVRIVYDAASSYKLRNEHAIAVAGLTAAAVARTVSEGLRHNKFIVLLDQGKPVAVWTGSTNLSAGGIFGHSNVGHIVWDAVIAQAYLDYWERLAQNLTPTRLREPNRTATPLPAGATPKRSVTPLFCPRDDKDQSTTIQWYADRMAEAGRMVCMMVAFNLDVAFQQVIARESDVLRYIIKDDALAADESVGVDHDVLFAAGGRLPEGALANFLGERSNPLNANRYVHGKFMLLDSLGADPTVITGSANFSRPSQRSNDENMLVIRGDTRVADLYFGEFMRVFDHHYARYVVQRQQETVEAGYLKETEDAWLPPHFDPDSPKSKRRRYFVGR